MSDEMNEDGLVVDFYRIEMILMHSFHGYYYAVFSNVGTAALQVEMTLMC